MQSIETMSLPTLSALLSAVIAATPRRFPGGVSFGGVTYTAASLQAQLQGLLDAINAVAAARQRTADQEKALLATQVTALPVLRAYLKLIRAVFGSSQQALSDFGLPPTKARTPLTSVQKTVAAAKARATRAARGTVGSRKKLAVKGDVAGVVMTNLVTPPPVPAPAAGTAPAAAPPAASPQPAPVAPVASPAAPAASATK